jgi:hypothetical protein
MTNGIPYLDYPYPIPAGQRVVLAAEYYLTNWSVIPAPTVSVQALGIASAPEIRGEAVVIDRSLRLTNGTFLIEFPSRSNRVYQIQYNRTGLEDWKTAVPPIIGTGRRIQWIDLGPPKTDVSPASVSNRFYRIFVQP